MDSRSAGEYGIPADNPFVGVAGSRDEIYAYGLRNPWKFSFDSQTGDLWLADVGQNAWEEIDLIENGGNYGWDRVEGPACFQGSCDLSAYDAPIFSYPHTSAGTQGGFSITGGFVYRGSNVGGLDGTYLYADFILRRFWGLRYDVTTQEATVTSFADALPGSISIASINEGPGGEAYVVDYRGTIYTLGGFIVANEESPEGAFGIEIAGPNPVREATTFALAVPAGEHARVTLLDALGREVARLYDGPATPGQRLALDARDLAPGVYLVHLDTPSRSAVRRIVVAR